MMTSYASIVLTSHRPARISLPLISNDGELGVESNENSTQEEAFMVGNEDRRDASSAAFKTSSRRKRDEE